MSDKAQAGSLHVSESATVSTLWLAPPKATACYVLAHGAGAGMKHAFMEKVSQALAAHGIATLRFQFPYMEKGSRRTDSPALCHATVRAAVARAAELTDVPLLAGGRSFGGRMTSQAQALQPLPRVRGLAFLGFPLHPPKSPGDERARHLDDVHVPMLFLQGTRDEFADLSLLQALIARLGSRATLDLFEAANHSFHVPARSGRTDEQVFDGLIGAFVKWAAAVTQK